MDRVCKIIVKKNVQKQQLHIITCSVSSWVTAWVTIVGALLPPNMKKQEQIEMEMIKEMLYYLHNVYYEL